MEKNSSEAEFCVTTA